LGGDGLLDAVSDVVVRTGALPHQWWPRARPVARAVSNLAL